MSKIIELIKSGDLERALKLIGSQEIKRGRSLELIKLRIGCLQGLGKLKESLYFLSIAHKMSPANREITNDLILTLDTLGQSQEALQVALSEANSGRFYDPVLLSKLWFKVGHIREAVAVYEKHPQIRAIDSDFYLTLLAHEGRLDDAEKFATEVTTGNYSAGIAANLSLAGIHSKNYLKAIEYASLALSLDSSNSDALTNLAAAYNAVSRYDATVQLAEAFNVSGLRSPGFFCNVGAAFDHVGQYQSAEKFYRKSLDLDPTLVNASINLGCLLLSEGRYSEAWPHYCKGVSLPSRQPYLSVRELHSVEQDVQVLIVHGDGGIGDILVFLPYFKKLEGIDCYLEAPEKLRSLIESNFRIRVFNTQNPLPEQVSRSGRSISLQKIPLIFGPHSPEELDLRQPLQIASTNTSPEFDGFFRQFKGKRLCGLSWRSKNTDFGAQKSLEISDLLPLRDMLNTEFVALQYDCTDQDCQDFEEVVRKPLHRVPGVDLWDDMIGVCQIINACSFIISSSNTVAHLAGRLLKPTHLLVPFSTARLFYWRLDESGRCVWYPSIQILDLKSNEKWSEGVARLTAQLNPQ